MNRLDSPSCSGFEGFSSNGGPERPARRSCFAASHLRCGGRLCDASRRMSGPCNGSMKQRSSPHERLRQGEIHRFGHSAVNVFAKPTNEEMRISVRARRVLAQFPT
jgi:hypothetical protein